jgi:hypothetical protein
VQALGWGVPVMVSHGRLRRARTLPRATAPWVCDSRGFTELSTHGRWTIGAREYADALLRYTDGIGQLAWASPQDWMCEPWILAKTGRTVADHQQLTTESVALLRELLAGRVHIIPVVQGYRLADYERHDDLYLMHGIDLRAEPVVGLGSVCRRQSTTEIRDIVTLMAGRGLALHGFGVKTAGLRSYGPLLASADSFAWSYGGRRRGGLCGHEGGPKWEANCKYWAMNWRTHVLSTLDGDS